MEPTRADLVVIGAGPGGYAAAFYAADQGRHVILVDQDKRLGGVCLHRGCIPSKALLHATGLLREVRTSGRSRGISFGEPQVNLERLRAWKASIIDHLAQGLSALSQRRGITVVSGRGRFEDSRTLRVETENGQPAIIRYETAIVAVGSTPAIPQALACDSPRIMTSTEALELPDIPQSLLVVGGGYIGLELGTIYAALGSRVVLVEAMASLLMGVDADLVQPVLWSAREASAGVRVNTRVLAMTPRGQQITVTIESNGQQSEERYDRVLVAVGRVPACDDLGLERTRVTRNPQGFIQVNAKQQTSDPAIYAIGDVTGGPLLAHKASTEARIAVEAITPAPTSWGGVKPRIIPAVVYTDPEIAWCGLTEAAAAAKGMPIKVTTFPWSASGRAVSLGRPDGLTKLILEPETGRILGVGIVGTGASELISEGVLAMELGATAKDLTQTVHPHPTLSETLKEAAELCYGHATHALARPSRKGPSIKPSAPARQLP